jgi:hypothetical protein
MANTYHDQLSGNDLHPSKIDPTTGTELTAASQTTYDGRWLPHAFFTVGPGAANDYVTTGTNDSAKINSAIAAASAAGGGDVLLNGLTFSVASRITPQSNVRVFGLGKGITKLTGGVAFDYTFYNTATLARFVLQDLTIDCANGNRASGARLQNASNCVMQNVEFKNVASGGWMFVLGVSDGLNAPVANFDNKLIDCDFDTHAGSLEMLLLLNCKNTQVLRPTFRNKTTGGPSWGSIRSATTVLAGWSIRAQVLALSGQEC